MKRISVLALLLALLSAGLLAGASFAVQRQGDQVAVTAETLAGDPSAAEGLRVNLPLVRGNCLYWDISFPAGHPEQSTAQFRYNPEGEPPVFTQVSSSVGFPVGYGHTTIFYPNYENDKNQDWVAMLEQLADGMEPDTERTRTVRLTDYMAYWPIKARLSDCPLSGEVLNDLMSSYFTIPIPPDYHAEFTLTADSSGQLCYTEFYADLRYLSRGGTWCFDTPQGYLFTFSNAYYNAEQNESLLMDGSKLPAGWGLYRLTVNGDSTGGQLETVYTLPEGSEILDFLTAGDESAYFLLTREEGLLRLRVFDQRAVLQNTFDLLPMDEDVRYAETYLGDGFLVPILSGADSVSRWLAAVVSGPQGWQPAFTADLTRQESLGCSLLYRADLGELAMDYEDGRLAIRGAHQRPGFYLAVYSQAGLEYLGVCATSLAPPAVRDTIADYEGQGYYALARGNTLPLVDWSETAS